MNAKVRVGLQSPWCSAQKELWKRIGLSFPIHLKELNESSSLYPSECVATSWIEGASDEGR